MKRIFLTGWAITVSVSVLMCVSLGSGDVASASSMGSGGLANSAWPCYGHDSQHTHRSPHIGSTTNHLKWACAITDPGAVPSALSIAADGMVYAAGGRFALVAVNPNGTPSWSQVFRGSAAFAPAIDTDGAVYASSGYANPSGGDLHALNPDGSQKWSSAAGGGGASSSPAIGADGTVYVGGDDGRLHAFNSDGTLKWTYSPDGIENGVFYYFDTPAIGADGTIFGVSDGLYAFDPDGTLKWHSPAGTGWGSTPAIGPDGTVYTVGGDGKVRAFDPEGTLKWSCPGIINNGGSPGIGADGTVYVAGADDTLCAVNPDGTIKWTFSAAGHVGSPAIDANGTIYVGCADGTLYALNPDGDLVWSYTTAGGLGTPVIGANGTVYVSSVDGNLYAFGSEPGAASNPYPRPTTPDSQRARPAIVLVGGLNEDYGLLDPGSPDHPWHDVYSFLGARGYDVYVVPSRVSARAPSIVDSTGGFTGDNAIRVERYLEDQGLHDRDVIIIGHSMGGLIARRWAAAPMLWRGANLNPKAIIQLGTPNAGSPLPVIEHAFGGGSKSLFELDDCGPAIGAFNRMCANYEGIPIMKLGGEFFPAAAQDEMRSLESGFDWQCRYPALGYEFALVTKAFAWEANDGAVSIESLLSGPVAVMTGQYPVMHADAFGLNLFTSQGFILPKRDTAHEDQILAQIGKFCGDVAEGRIKADPHPRSATQDSARTALRLSALSTPEVPASTKGDTFATIVDTVLGLTEGATSTVDFSVEGTSAVAGIAGTNPGIRLALMSEGEPVPFVTQASSDGSSVSFASTPGSRYTLQVHSDVATQTVVRVLDTGATSLVVCTQASGAGGSDALVTARLVRASANQPGSFAASVDDGPYASLADDGIGADAIASDGVYSGHMRLPASGGAARVTVDASATVGGIAIHRTGFGFTEIVEPRAVLDDVPTASTGLTSSGKVGQLFVDVPVSASEDCTLQVAADVVSSGDIITQSMEQKVVSSGASTVRVVFDAQDLRAITDSGGVVASVTLYDSTDGGLALLGSGMSAQIALSRADLALASCTIDPFDKPVSAAPVVITGRASCSTETITGIDISLDGGGEWVPVPAPSAGWGSNDTTWSCAFTLPDGEYGASVRLRGASGPIVGATDSLVFTVDVTAPQGSMALARGAGYSQSAFTVDSNVTGASQMRTRASKDSTSWGGWTDWEPYSSSIDVYVAASDQKWWYQVEYRDYADNRLTLTDDVVIDATAPTTTSTAKATYDLRASINLLAADALSGVAKTEWRLDGGGWANGTTVSAATPGNHVLEFRSTDGVGNVEQTKSVTFCVRSTADVRNPIAPTTMSRTKFYTVYAYLKPRHAPGSYPVLIYKYRNVSGKWKSYGSAKAKAANYSSYTKCAVKLKLTTKGKWRLRAYAPGDSYHVATWSSGYDYVTVK